MIEYLNGEIRPSARLAFKLMMKGHEGSYCNNGEVLSKIPPIRKDAVFVPCKKEYSAQEMIYDPVDPNEIITDQIPPVHKKYKKRNLMQGGIGALVLDAYFGTNYNGK